MPITKSAQKALRQTKKRTKRNLGQKAQLETLMKKATSETLSLVVSKIDKAVKNHLLSQGRANRLKSRLLRKLKPQKLAGRPKIQKTSRAKSQKPKSK